MHGNDVSGLADKSSGSFSLSAWFKTTNTTSNAGTNAILSIPYSGGKKWCGL